MNWNLLENEGALNSLREKSFSQAQVIFKHSTRCSISDMAKSRLDAAETPDFVDFYYLDLIRFRNLSNTVAEIFQVHHESPQILVIKSGECVYEVSHWDIRFDDILEEALSAN